MRIRIELEQGLDWFPHWHRQAVRNVTLDPMATCLLAIVPIEFHAKTGEGATECKERKKTCAALYYCKK